jgi:hypothetical protein
MGICRWRANPLPEPHGMMPNAVLVCTNERAISLIVPSPPMATTAKTSSLAFRAAISTACPAHSV